ncbi:MAG: hypothetical protein LBC82_04775 [Oscillospiraceae bacterium]|nr:hypothetical protein [Oscillospiraceae bacterium]
MKIKKCILSAFVFMAISFAFFCGCSKPNESEEILPLASFMPVIISDVENGDFRKAIINKINISQLMDEEQHQADGSYKANKISEITEFYYPTIKFEGYELYSVAIFDGVFIFRYVPLEFVGDDTSILLDIADVIEISIRRFDQFRAEAKQAQNEGWGYLSEDGMLYAEEYSNIVAQIGNTTVRIDVPKKFNSYEFLRDLAFRLIETSEVVDVQAEIDIIRQSES